MSCLRNKINVLWHQTLTYIMFHKHFSNGLEKTSIEKKN